MRRYGIMGLYRSVILFVSLLLVFSSPLMLAVYAGQTIQASVTVVCPFSLTLNALPLYQQSGNIILNYSIATIDTCNSISGLNGNFVLTYQPNSVALLTQSVSVSSANQVAK